MEFFEKNEKERRASERIVLIIYTLYISMMSSVVPVSNGNWRLWMPIVTVISIVFLWYMFLTEYKNYGTRTLVSSIIIEVSLLIYGFNGIDIERMLPTFFVFTVLIGLYGVKDYIIIAAVVKFLIMLYYIFINLNEPGGHNEIMQVARQSFSVVVFDYLVLTWVKKRQDTMVNMRQIVESLKKVENSKDDFLANVSHEIRTPLNTILGMSEVILDNRDSEDTYKNVQQIQDASRNLMSLVNDILDYTELQSGELAVEEEVYSITSTVNNIVNMAMAKKGDKPIELIVDLDPRIPNELFGDEKKIRRVAMNLINNAIKFTNSGYVRIKISGREESYGYNLTIVVQDTGIGMNEENSEKLFTSFRQIDKGRNRQTDGVGLGLAISRAISQKLGGVIQLRSTPGKGTTMTFVVPQKIVDNRHAVELNNYENLRMLCYINMEQYNMMEIRDAYRENIVSMISKMGLDGRFCRNIDDIKRRLDNEKCSHLFITSKEYEENPEFFETITSQIKVIMVREDDAPNLASNSKIMCIDKPFYILPVVGLLNHENAEAGKHKKDKFIAPKVNCLVVDDNFMNIRVIEELLKKYEINVVYALSGSEALKKIDSMNYDFIFMDHMMPEMDGIETFKRIRGKMGSYYQRVPVIALTANAVAGRRDMFLKEGFTDFLEKPVEISVLERVLRRNIPEEKIVYIDDSEQKENTNSDELVIEDVDVKQGTLYCGGEAGYIGILTQCCENYTETAGELNKLYEKQDWKNYIIKIHALKGIMKSIGAMNCSEMAKKLEFAGKEEKYDIIVNEHSAVMNEYKTIMQRIADNPLVPVDSQIIRDEAINENNASDQSLDELTELDESKKDEYIALFEDAMYSLDDEQMNIIMNDLSGYKYKGTILMSELKHIKKKIAQADYFSAGDDLKELFESIDNAGGETV